MQCLVDRALSGPEPSDEMIFLKTCNGSTCPRIYNEHKLSCIAGTRVEYGLENAGTSEGQLGTAAVSLFVLPLGRVPPEQSRGV